MPQSDKSENLAEKVENKEITIGVDPATARHAFMKGDPDVLTKEIDEPLTYEKWLVTIPWALEFITLLAGMALSIYALGWLSLIAMPIMLLMFFVLGGQASMGHQEIITGIIAIIAGIFVAYFLRSHGIFMIWWLLLLPMPYFFARLTYKLSVDLMRSLVIRNKKAFELFKGEIVFTEES